MLTRERHTLIRSRLDEDGKVVAADLAEEFAVSEDTIRRDLRELAAGGHCERVYGGALARRSPAPISARLSENRAVKSRLGREIVPLLPEGGFVFIDAGSTNLAIAEAISRERRLTVMTNAPTIAAALSLATEVEVIMTGGVVDRDVCGAVDAQAIASLESVYPDVFFIGACRIDAERGIFTSRWDEHIFKRAIAQRSGRIVAAAEAAKFSAEAPYHVAAFSPAVTLVVEADLAEARLAPIEQQGVRIIRTGQGEAG